jgi:uncharacterized protein YaaN involved in tellurite resistance
VTSRRSPRTCGRRSHATTIGLLVGTVAFALTLTRTRLYTEDLTALERATGHAPLAQVRA